MARRRTKAGDRAKFCASGFAWFGLLDELQWYDLTGVLELDDRRRVEIELVTLGTHGHYEGFLVTISSKDRGQLGQKVFRFRDYLATVTRKPDGDQRSARDELDGFKVIAHCGWDWYIVRPADTSEITIPIHDYIASWK